jgi:seryl-tRNA synthetase
MHLVCKFTLSKAAEEAEETIGKIVEKANKDLFLKGVPKEQFENAAKITEWTLKNKTLIMTVISGTYVRAPAAIMRFRKVLAQELGEKFKVGIRGVDVTDFIIEIPVEKLDAHTVDKVKSLAFIENAKFEPGKLRLLLKPIGESDLRRNVADRVLTLAKNVIQEAKREKVVAPLGPIVKHGKQKPIKFTGDPARIGLELGWIKEFPGRGQWIYTTPYVKLLESIEEILLKEVVHKLDFQPFMLPKLISMEVMKKMPGYLEEIPEGMYYVCPPPREPEAFAKFKEKLKVTREVPKSELKQVIKDPDYVLAPAQCEPFWQFFSHETLRLDDLPIKLYDRAGWTYRWEGGGVEGLVRVQEFRRIELVYLGTPEQVVTIRDTVRDNLLRVADEVLDLEWRVVAAAPFFLKMGEVGDVSESKNVAAYDIEVYMPYRGPRETAEWLEVAACFVHKTKFMDSFSIREVRNRPVWTGCCGLGISRWVAAFLATHGFNPKDWPKIVAESFGTFRLPKTLLWPPRQ